MTEIEAIRITINKDRTVLGEAINRACVDDPDLCRRVDPEPSVRSKASQMAQTARAESARTLQLLSTLMAGLVNVPGRKTIVLLSEGFVAEDDWPLVRETVTQAARANARIYTLDGRGSERGLGSILDTAPNTNDANTRLLEQMDFGADSVNSLAVDSGGFVVRNTNQFDTALTRIADDADNYYVLGIRPSVQPDGTFHRIQVRVKRPGVAVRARRGYIATPHESPVDTTPAPIPAEEPQHSGSTDAVDAGVASANPVGASSAPPEPSSVTGTVVPPAEPANGLRLRPDANLHADTLATMQWVQ